MQNIEIKPDTPIEDLRKAGIVPDWMAEDCDLHGMYEAENILCEWDWEDGWDLGDGYDKDQLEVLTKVRDIIRSDIGY
ncbi:MAG: hypothetical protein K2L11_11535 [Muribaculaceae bacterium]|nr:hypothetical protein [Muribaculaceae bacterium]